MVQNRAEQDSFPQGVFEKAFLEAFESLNPFARAALIFYVGDCEGIFEIAETLGVSHLDAEKYLSEGLNKILKRLEAKGISDSSPAAIGILLRKMLEAEPPPRVLERVRKNLGAKFDEFIGQGK